MVSAEEYKKLATDLSENIRNAKTLEELHYNRGKLDMLLHIAKKFERTITFNVDVYSKYG